MKFIVAGDNEKTAKKFAGALGALGDTECAAGAAGLLAALDKKHFDLAVIALPCGDVSVVSEVRRKRDLPVIIAAPSSTPEERVEYLRQGADDFVNEPVSSEELVARAEVCLRRTGAFSGTRYRLGELEVNFVNKMTTVGGEYVPMNRKTYEILELLVRNKEMVLPRQQIFDRIWGYYSATGMSVIEINVFRLRKMLEAHGLAGHLRTVKSTGYMWTEKNTD